MIVKLTETKTLSSGYNIKPAKSKRINGSDLNQAIEAAFAMSAFHGQIFYVIPTNYGLRIVWDKSELAVVAKFFAVNAETRTAELYS